MTSTATPLLDVEEVERVIGFPFAEWAHQCHGISVAIVKAGLLPGSRVARGTCIGVGGQHSWIVLGPDPYDPDVPIVDPTLWSYDSNVKGIWYGSASDGRHRPHGAGSVWEWGKVGSAATETVVPLAVSIGERAQEFLDLFCPGGLDRRAWHVLSHAPVGGWPAAEILAAMDDTPGLSALVPIDLLGMLTDRNPGGVYLPDGYERPPASLAVPLPGYQCLECQHVEVNRAVDHDDPDLACGRCLDDGALDPYIIERILVSPCPTPGRCNHEDHHYGRNEHWVHVEES